MYSLSWTTQPWCVRGTATERRKAFQHQTVACSFRLKSIVILSFKANLNAIECKFAKQPIIGILTDMTSQLNLQNLWSRGRPSIFSHLEYKKGDGIWSLKTVLILKLNGEVHKIGECIWLQTGEVLFPEIANSKWNHLSLYHVTNWKRSSRHVPLETVTKRK